MRLMHAFLLTNHEVCYGTVDTQGKDSHWNEINENFSQEKDRHTIVATHVLMTARVGRIVQPLNIMKLRYPLHEECFILDE